ncbi:hypothetical protein NDU88_001726 [Pleurodeles waltl]|uniref:Uncharacterized protein n=1 Tax=Pleurodeles waltl TaxID=8319 RepID=A0AAV7LYG0_PLEWA|nr:hypothetical protein NDU88_001726 [Pleurodeles waltl]
MGTRVARSCSVELSSSAGSQRHGATRPPPPVPGVFRVQTASPTTGLAARYLGAIGECRPTPQSLLVQPLTGYRAPRPVVASPLLLRLFRQGSGLPCRRAPLSCFLSLQGSMSQSSLPILTDSHTGKRNRAAMFACWPPQQRKFGRKALEQTHMQHENQIRFCSSKLDSTAR